MFLTIGLKCTVSIKLFFDIEILLFHLEYDLKCNTSVTDDSEYCSGYENKF